MKSLVKGKKRDRYEESNSDLPFSDADVPSVRFRILCGKFSNYQIPKRHANHNWNTEFCYFLCSRPRSKCIFPSKNSIITCNDKLWKISMDSRANTSYLDTEVLKSQDLDDKKSWYFRDSCLKIYILSLWNMTFNFLKYNIF